MTTPLILMKSPDDASCTIITTNRTGIPVNHLNRL